jgi:DegV family protein with EDD domain
MPRVNVVTDSTSYLPADVLEANQISVVSLYVNFGGGRTEREVDVTDYDAFFQEMRTAATVPTTSQPSVGDFMAVYEPLLAEGADIVSLHISGGISGTHESARQAAEQLERDGKGGERVHVIDTETVAGGLGMVVLAAARRALDGDDAAAVKQAAADARADLKIWFAVDTLEFLKRSGRIGGASAWVGSTLKIKPILTLEREMLPIERVRTSRRAFERLVEYARERKDSGADGWVVQHIQAQDEADALVERCREIFGREPLYVSELGAVLGAHAGPGMLGVGAMPARYTE